MKRKVGLSVVTAAIIGAGIVLSGCGGGGSNVPSTKTFTLTNPATGAKYIGGTIICGSQTITDASDGAADGSYTIPGTCTNPQLDVDNDGTPDKSIIFQNGQPVLAALGTDEQKVEEIQQQVEVDTGYAPEEGKQLLEQAKSGTTEVNPTEVQKAALATVVGTLATVDPQLQTALGTGQTISSSTILESSLPDSLKSEIVSLIDSLENAQDVKTVVKELLEAIDKALGCLTAPEFVLLQNREVQIGNRVVQYKLKSDGTATFDTITIQGGEGVTVDNFFHIKATIDPNSLVCKDGTYSADLKAKVTKGNKSVTILIHSVQIVIEKVMVDDKEEYKVTIKIPQGATIAVSNEGVLGLSQIAPGETVTATVDRELVNTDLDVNVRTLINSLAQSDANKAKLEQTLQDLNQYLQKSGTYTVCAGITTDLPVKPKKISGTVDVVVPTSSSSSSVPASSSASSETSSSSSSTPASSSSSSEMSSSSSSAGTCQYDPVVDMWLDDQGNPCVPSSSSSSSTPDQGNGGQTPQG